MAEFVVLLAPKFFECNVTALSEKATKALKKLQFANFFVRYTTYYTLAIFSITH